MKIALVCDDLIQHGGHERVIMDFCEIFPDAPLYTAAASKRWQEICSKKKIKLKTTFVQKLPFIEKLNRYYAPLMVHVFALQSFDFSKYDLVVSISSRFAHGIITKPQTLHICYMSTPGRMFWEPNEYFLPAGKSLTRMILTVPLHLIRLWDFTAAQRVDYFFCNSLTTQKRIAKYYKRESAVIYPGINTQKFSGLKTENDNFFLVITRLASWKSVDIAIEACKDLGLKLKIIGTGPDKSRLEKLAGGFKNTQFLGYIPEEDKLEVLRKCTAVINTQLEDFGIVPLEAMAAGKPVIAYGKGGAVETVIPEATGEFFYEQNADSLAEVLKNFDPSKYSVRDCKDRAKKFDKSVFRKCILEGINYVL